MRFFGYRLSFFPLKCMLLLLGVQCAYADGRWVPIGPEGENIVALAINPKTPTTLYAAGSGVFRSTDGGKNWSAINTGLTNLRILTLAVNPQTPTILYAGTYGGGVFRSTDEGESWSAVNVGLTDLGIEALAIDPQTPTTLYAGTSVPNSFNNLIQVPIRGGVFRSTDGGDSWVDTGLISIGIQALVINPQTPTTLYAAGDGLFRSTDGGNSWSKINTGFRTLAIDPHTPTTLYAGRIGSSRTRDSLFRSVDGGESWSAVNTGLFGLSIHALVINPKTPTTLYAGAGSARFQKIPVNTRAAETEIFRMGVLRSTDEGESWSAVNSGLTDVNIRALAIDPQTPTTLYAGTFNSSVFKFFPDGEPGIDLDIDGNGKADALTDGILIIRYLFGFSSKILCDSAVAPDAIYTCEEIEAYLEELEFDSVLDVDEDGQDDALTDGILFIRYLFGFRDNTLCDGAVTPGAARTCREIETYIEDRVS